MLTGSPTKGKHGYPCIQEAICSWERVLKLFAQTFSCVYQLLTVNAHCPTDPFGS